MTTKKERKDRDVDFYHGRNLVGGHGGRVPPLF